MVNLVNPSSCRQAQPALDKHTVKTKEKMLVPGP